MASLSFTASAAVACKRAKDAFSGRRPQISLITDFGNGDEAVYAIRSAARNILPRAEISDICHDVPLGNLLVGAWRLRRAAGLPTEAPGTAYVAVVDPGVGGDRRNLIIRTKDGHFLIGPDNGVLSLASSQKGVERAVEVRNEGLTLLHLAQSRTFHGKDVFAPAAAHVLRGVPLEEFGPEIDPATLARITISADATERSRAGCLVDIDGFGSVRTNVPNHIPEEAIGRPVEFGITGPKPVSGRARVVRTFAEAERDEPVFVLSSTGCLDLAVNLGSASGHFGISHEHIGVGRDLRPVSTIELKLS
ncbi:MAG: SAM-dependent chlorinase/fluorinase [Candidatus Micrarchaeota archaeon]